MVGLWLEKALGLGSGKTEIALGTGEDRDMTGFGVWEDREDSEYLTKDKECGSVCGPNSNEKGKGNLILKG